MNNLPEPKLTLGYVASLSGLSNHYCIYKESHEYTFFGYVRRSKKLVFKSISEEEVRKVFKSLGGSY